MIMTLVDRIRALAPLLKDRPWARWAGYPGFFLVAFFAFFWLTFPSEQLASRIELEAKRRFDVQLEVGSARPALFSGVVLKDVDWILKDDGTGSRPGKSPAVAAAAKGEGGGGEGGGEEPAPPPGPPRVRVDRATVKLGIFNTLRGRTDVSFDVDAFGGEIEGRVIAGEDERTITATAHDVDLARSPIKASGLELEGMLRELTVEVKAEGGDIQKAEGTVLLKGEKLVLEGGEVQHYDLPRIELGELDGAIEIGGGKADFTTFEVKGADLEAKIEGFVRLAAKTTSSTVSGKIKLKPSDAWWAKNESLKSIANMALPAQKDGFRLINVFGQVAKPSFRPQR